MVMFMRLFRFVLLFVIATLMISVQAALWPRVEKGEVLSRIRATQGGNRRR
jgi:hypothetical protein